jgi:hypothetical protein
MKPRIKCGLSNRVNAEPFLESFNNLDHLGSAFFNITLDEVNTRTSARQITLAGEKRRTPLATKPQMGDKAPFKGLNSPFLQQNA